MKSVIAVAVASMFALPVLASSVQAASVTLSTNGIYLKEHNKHHDHGRKAERHCRTKVVKHWRNHKMVVEKQTVCD